MTCVFPIDAWRAAECNESGKRGIVFDLRSGLVDQPLQVPCGKCVGCMSDRSMIWSVRMAHEASLHDRNCFVTLTYRDPPPVFINKLDLQLFFKRLRRMYKVRYFACGEYGERTRRPHYHAVIFGEDFLGGAYDISETMYGNPYLDRAWGHGFVSVGAVTLASCMYVAGYATKKIGDPDTFNLMSRRPGIGHAWLDKYRDDIRRTEVCVIDGQEFPVPKKYLEWEEDYFDDLRVKRKAYFDNLSGEERWDKRTRLRPRQVKYEGRLRLRKEVL